MKPASTSFLSGVHEQLRAVGGLWIFYAFISQDKRQLLEQRITQAHPWRAPEAVIFGANVIVVMLQPPRHP